MTDQNPLMMEFIVDVPPGELDLQLINLLIRVSVNEKEAVLRACKFVTTKLEEKKKP